MTAPRIAIVHAVAVSMAPIRQAFARLWPEARTTNLLEDSLSADLAAAGRITPAIVERFLTLARYNRDAGADAILFSCSAFGTAIDAVKKALPIPVLKPNEAMIDEALDAGPRIALLVTFPPSIPSLSAEFEEAAAARGMTLQLTARHVPDAMAALDGGDGSTHDRLIAQAAAALTECDALVLGQFSMARARAAIPDLPGRKVVTSPESAVVRLKAVLQG
jgi:Asp/Glu/hydantoin racemase